MTRSVLFVLAMIHWCLSENTAVQPHDSILVGDTTQTGFAPEENLQDETILKDIPREVEGFHISHKAQTKIVGGREVRFHSAPFMVFIVIDPKDPKYPDDRQQCGGSLISVYHVLTAAHCIEEDYEVEFMLVGVHDIADHNKRQRAYAASYVIHKHYDMPMNANDIAIIKLKRPVVLSRKVGLVTLPRYDKCSEFYVGKRARAYGWGITSDPKGDLSASDILLGVNVTVISNDECLRYAPHKDVYEGDLCTSGIGKRGTCYGDSGGPLMLGNTQIGITSRGVSEYCARGHPSVYVRVSHYVFWIRAQMRNM